MTRDEEADRHWAEVSNLTQLSAPHRRERRAGIRQRARVRVGLALVRAGLALAPVRADDFRRRLAGVEPR